MSELRTLYWNARGLRRKIPVLRHLLRHYSIDVALINETHLHPAFSSSLPGYHVLRLDTTAETSQRGLLVAVRRNLPFQPLPSFDTQSFQSLGVETTIDAKPTRIFAIYRPCNLRLDLGEVRRLLHTSPALAAGDWNAHHPAWGCRSPNSAGGRLYRDSQRSGYDVEGPDEFTHFPGSCLQHPSTIDLVVHRGLKLDIEVLPEAHGSDHVPVLVIINGQRALARVPPSRGCIDWERFETTLQSNPPPCSEPLVDAASVDRLERVITSQIQGAMDTATTPHSTRGLPPLPQWIQTLIAKKRKTRIEWQITRDPALKAKLNGLVERIRAALESRDSASWEDRIMKANSDQSSMHKLSRQIMRKRPPVNPIRHSDGSLRYT